jgi:hypothetical protein
MKGKADERKKSNFQDYIDYKIERGLSSRIVAPKTEKEMLREFKKRLGQNALKQERVK